MTQAERIIFSDLDGCLLDEKTYEWEPARDLLEQIKREGVPLVFLSSKTRPEIEHLRNRLGIRDPFSSENGAAVFFEDAPPVVLGGNAKGLRSAAASIARQTGIEIELLSDMTIDRIMQVTGLTPDAAVIAARREYSQPFLAPEASLEPLRKAAEERGLRIIEGNRFFHLLGDHDKGDAVALLRRRYPRATAIGVGDGPNDVPMLRAVAAPVFLGPEHPVGLPRHTLFEGERGPVGWTRAVRKALANLPVRTAEG
jgi:mannosyl-3-phosphoglycerate phosphatase